jgi:subtilisin family serine protease
MIISIVNFSEFTDEYVQEVTRAINRQIEADFAPYWHRSGELRLEGAVGRKPNPKNPQELRGDAMIYLWDEIDQQEALGFHDLNFRGIPFSIVFTQLSEELGESWTVTLSHEALELLMDPEANLLVQGPHPEDPERRVYHWYEMCDAVQAQTYLIDEIEVSNFLLPLYFTESNEPGSRNDFLGIEGEDGPLRSFGVADGGYVGFFDPETGEHDQYVSPRERARERLVVRKRAGLTRRTVRRQLDRSPEPALRNIFQRTPDDTLPGPWFEGFAIDVRSRGGEDPYDVLDSAATAALGGSWRSRWNAFEPSKPRARGDVEYDLVPRGSALPPERVWELCHALRRQPGVVDVEPDFVFFRSDGEQLYDLPPQRRWALFGGGHLGGTDGRYEWSLEQIRAKQAWSMSQGERIVIGHPDTGFLAHPEIWPAVGGGPIDTSRDYDFVQDEDDAHAEPDEFTLPLGGPNHGTATASVIVSAPGRPVGASPGSPFVSGIAPKATLVPLRVSNLVVHFSMRRLRKAIEYATTEGFHVLSMSLGGPLPNRHLRRAVREAVKDGMILVAASGNHIPFRFVVWPARYPEVICAAACNAEERPWSGSSRGEAVDISAPGESVWRAMVDTDAAGAARYRVERSSGTSYAAANVAGVAALWLSHHGRNSLFQKYGAHLTDAFRLVLDRTARDVPGLGAGFGAGIVDAEAVLNEPLPTLQQVAGGGAGMARRARAAADDGALSTLSAQLPHFSTVAVRRGLEALLATDSRGLAGRLREAGDELAFQFACDPRLLRQFSAHCRKSDRRRKARANRAARAAEHALDVADFADLRGRLVQVGSPHLAAVLAGRILSVPQKLG